jgi:hypothetical protein
MKSLVIKLNIAFEPSRGLHTLCTTVLPNAIPPHRTRNVFSFEIWAMIKVGMLAPGSEAPKKKKVGGLVQFSWHSQS